MELGNQLYMTDGKPKFRKYIYKESSAWSDTLQYGKIYLIFNQVPGLLGFLGHDGEFHFSVMVKMARFE